MSCVSITGYKVADTWGFRQGWPHGAGVWIEVPDYQVLRSVMVLKGSGSPCESKVLRQWLGTGYLGPGLALGHVLMWSWGQWQGMGVETVSMTCLWILVQEEEGRLERQT